MIFSIYLIIGLVLVGIVLTGFFLSHETVFYLSDFITLLSVFVFWPLHLPFIIAALKNEEDYDIILWKKDEREES